MHIVIAKYIYGQRSWPYIYFGNRAVKLHVSSLAHGSFSVFIVKVTMHYSIKVIKVNNAL